MNQLLTKMCIKLMHPDQVSGIPGRDSQKIKMQVLVIGFTQRVRKRKEASSL
jgi:hypothetical protein